MACPGGEAHPSITNTNCAGGCWGGPEGTNSDISKDGKEVWKSVNEKGPYKNREECKDQCINGCAVCSGQCGNQCTGCSGACSSSCTSGCSGSCRGNCSGRCQGSCQGTCAGGCQGSCQEQCNKGCSNEEQLGNVTQLDRIVRAPNIQKIFRFLIYEIEKRRGIQVPQIYKDNINELTGWTKDQEESLLILYNTIPRIFEEIFQNILREENIQIQSGSLNPNDNYKPYFPGAEAPSEYKWWTDKPSAEAWVKKANELYNELIGIYDAK